MSFWKRKDKGFHGLGQGKLRRLRRIQADNVLHKWGRWGSRVWGVRMPTVLPVNKVEQ